MRNVAIALFLLVTPTLLADPAVVDVGGRKVRVRSEGTGPSVVFECGFSETLDTWRDVVPGVAKFAHAFAYDRAGMGGSDPIPGDRSYTNIATELHTLLHHENIAPPYLIVGHSYGGPLARVFY